MICFTQTTKFFIRSPRKITWKMRKEEAVGFPSLRFHKSMVGVTYTTTMMMGVRWMVDLATTIGLGGCIIRNETKEVKLDRITIVGREFANGD